jgi:hypothetical protein
MTNAAAERQNGWSNMPMGMVRLTTSAGCPAIQTLSVTLVSTPFAK